MFEAEGVVFLQKQSISIEQSKGKIMEGKVQKTAKVTSLPEIISLRQALKNIMDKPWKGINVDFQLLPEMHPAAEYAISATDWSASTTGNFHIFTDGSAWKGKAAWAFVIICQVQTSLGPKYARIGYAGSNLGDEDNYTAIDAEAMAIISAAEYVLALPRYPDMHVYFHYDATAVGRGAWGQQKCPTDKTGKQLPQDARIMISLLQRKIPDSKGFHVKARNCNPFNEMADGIAGFIRRGWKCPIEPVSTSVDLRSHALKEWAWLEVEPDEFFPDIQTILQNDMNEQESYAMDPLFEKVEHDLQKDHVDIVDHDTSFSLKIASANVGTFGYHGEEMNSAASYKLRDIIRQFHEHEYGVVAVQETRASVSQTIVDGPYVRIISAGHRGQAGVELWIHVENISAKLNTDFNWSQDMTVWHFDPRCIAATLSSNGFKMHCVVIYAPQSGRTDHEIVEWWNALRAVLKKRDRSIPMVLMGDCNGKLGMINTDHIGDVAPDLENVAGEQIRMLCQEEDMYIPSTMADYHQGQTWTFQGPRGNKSRIDYIMVTTDCFAGVKRSFVDKDIELMNGDRDHEVVAVEMSVTKHQSHTSLLERKTVYDRCAAREHSKQEQHDEWLIIPNVPWKCGVNEHWGEIRANLTQAAMKAFPKQKRQRRQHYFSSTTWNMICRRKDLKQTYRQINKAKNSIIIQQCFAAWCKHSRQKAPSGDLDIHLLQMQEAILMEQRQNIDAKYRALKREDWKKWVYERTQDETNKAREAQGADIFKLLQPKKMVQKHSGKLRKEVPGLCDAQGQWRFSRESIAQGWQEQFSRIENAKPTTMSQLVKLSSPQRGSRSLEYLKDIPSLYALEKAVRTLDVKKAAGADNIGAELLKLHAPMNVQKLYMLFLKTAVRGQAIPELTGGWLVPLHKGRQSQRLMSSYRAILLEPTTSRAFSRAWRPMLESGLAATAAPGQWGGRKGQSVEAVHLQARLWVMNAAQLQQSLTLVFVDLKSAFYTVIKQFLAGGPWDLNTAEQVFRYVNLPHEAFQDFAKQFKDMDLIHKGTGSRAAADMTHATLKHTWFGTHCGTHVCAPQTGSRPGDPLADLMFSYLVARMLDVINYNLQDAECFASVPEHDLTLARSIAWVDDMVFAVQSPANELVSKTCRVLSEIMDIMALHGFELSYGQGKTAALMSFRGVGSIKARQECENKFPESLPIVTEFQGVIQVPIVAHYKHLGAYLDRSGSVQSEVKIRAGQTAAKVAPLKRILRNQQIPLKQRRIILQSMAVSVLTMHIGTWCNIGVEAFKTWKSAVFKTYATLHRRWNEGECTHRTLVEMAHEAGNAMPMELLHLGRLRLFRHMLQEADIFLVSLLLWNHRIAENKSWISALKGSLLWMQDQLGDLGLPDEVWGLRTHQDWDAVSRHHERIRIMIRHAKQSHLWRIRVMQEMQCSNSQQEALLKEMNWQSPPPQENDRENTVSCTTCGQMFPSQAALATHEQRRHGARIAVRRFARDAICRICQRNYHVRTKLLHHWHHGGTGCWRGVMRNFSPMSVEETQLLNDQDRKEGNAFHQDKLKSRTQDMLWRPATQEELERFHPIPQQVDLSEPTEDELETWRAYGLLPPGQGGRAVTIRALEDGSVPNVLEDVQNLERELNGARHLWKPMDDWIPRPFAKGEKFALIMFSGHRRFGDLGCWISWNTALTPICLDLAIDQKLGNILDMGLWTHLVHNRKVLACHAGPPCETFTEARWLDLQNPRKPKPPRTARYPWGLLGRSLREVKQGAMGTILFFRTVYFLLLVHASGGATTLEHPRGPLDTPEEGGERWAVWFSAMLRRFQQDAHVGTVQFLQGPLGQPFAKPTTYNPGGKIARTSTSFVHGLSARMASYRSSWRT